MAGDERLQQQTDLRMDHFADARLQLRPHIVHGSRRTLNAELFAESFEGVSLGHDAANLVEDQLDPLVERIAAPVHLDEIAGRKFVFERGHILKDLGANLAGHVLQDQSQVVAALA